VQKKGTTTALTLFNLVATRAVQILSDGLFLDEGQSGNSAATLRASQWAESNSAPAF
jgi:hypothetical protein